VQNLARAVAEEFLGTLIPRQDFTLRGNRKGRISGALKQGKYFTLQHLGTP
jgi:hypothetical protein